MLSPPTVTCYSIRQEGEGSDISHEPQPLPNALLSAVGRVKAIILLTIRTIEPEQIDSLYQ